MLMIDVRNAVAGILDRYSLDNVVEVTMRKEERDAKCQAESKPSKKSPSRRADPEDGFLAGLLTLKPSQ